MTSSFDFGHARNINSIENDIKEMETLFPIDKYGERDFEEDMVQENGCYLNFCIVCGHDFVGNKHRMICKLCVKKGVEE